jgi:hypothetical protein
MPDVQPIGAIILPVDAQPPAQAKGRSFTSENPGDWNAKENSQHQSR